MTETRWESSPEPQGAGTADRGHLDISHQHARALALCWEDSGRPDFSITVLAHTGAIRPDIEAQLTRDLEVLMSAMGEAGQSQGTAQAQIGALLSYVRRSGPRPAPPGWAELPDDGQFLARMRAMVRGGSPRLETRTDQGGLDRRAAPAWRSPRPLSGSYQDPVTAAAGTAYERIGGAAAVKAAVDLFYSKVMADSRIAHYFDEINMARLKAHQRAMITTIAGGQQDEYADREEAHRRLQQAHEHLRITDADFDIVVGHLVATLAELHVPDDLIKELAPEVLQLRNDVVDGKRQRPMHKQEAAVNNQTNAATSVYDRIGGAAAVKAAVDLFYEKLMNDTRVAHYFDDVNMARLKAHQRAMITAVAGGPNQYSGRSMHESHKALNITGQDFDIVVGHLVATLQELNVPQKEIELIAPPVLTLRDDIVTA